MKSLFIVLGFIAAVSALILAVTSLSPIAYIPAIAALILGFIAYYISKRKQSPKKTVLLIFLLTFISLVLTTYKAIFTTVEVGSLEELELKEEAPKEDSKELLEALDLNENDDIDVDMIDKRPQIEGLEDE